MADEDTQVLNPEEPEESETSATAASAESMLLAEQATQVELARLTNLAEVISSDRARIEATLQQHLDISQQATLEEQKAAAKSPLAIVYDLLGCEYATMHFDNGKAIPRYDFTMHPCIYGKSRPDQDCRDCGHVQYHRIGNMGVQLPMYEKRYPNAGVVIPITEEEADLLTDVMEENNIRPLTRHQSKLHALNTALTNATERENEARRRVQNAQQGQGGTPPPRGR